MFLTYILALAFLAIFGFTGIPVFLFFNMWNTCAAMRSPDANITSPDSICVDVRQYGALPHLHPTTALCIVLSFFPCHISFNQEQKRLKLCNAVLRKPRNQELFLKQ